MEIDKKVIEAAVNKAIDSYFTEQKLKSIEKQVHATLDEEIKYATGEYLSEYIQDNVDYDKIFTRVVRQFTTALSDKLGKIKFE